MKSMTCKELGGACDQLFHGNTFEEIASLSKKHGMEMFQKGDQGHLKAMQEMQLIMQKPDGMALWMSEKKKHFESLPG